MTNDKGMHELEMKNYLIGATQYDEIDESTFVLWKAELEKTLPSFWRAMQ